MKKNCIRNIIVHNADHVDLHTLADKVSEFHVQVIEQRLGQSNLTREQKVTIIDKIIENLKSREINGFIK